MKWNMTGVTELAARKDDIRYHFYGTAVKSHIDGSDTVYFRASKRNGFYLVSTLFMCFFMVASLVSVAALFYVRHIVRATAAVQHYDQWITPAMLSLQITIANRVLYTVAAVLTQWENHRLEDDYDFSLTGMLI